MAIKCVYFAERPVGTLWKPGWIFPLGYDLSQHFLLHDAPHRPALSVILPLRNDTKWEREHQTERGTAFCLDSCASGRPDQHWIVEIKGKLVDGRKPNITVSPSIDAKGIYHGYLKNGVLTDDLGA